jgi:diadenosine tetraphosphate (Ap4A) HIT family hydrolase
MNTHPSVAQQEPTCELCHQHGGRLLWNEADWRVVRVKDAAFPGFYRLISNHHAAEFSQLSPVAQARCLHLLLWLENLVIQHLRPTKMNLASLGNVVPHVHWHVVARFGWDSHFPSPIWAASQRVAPTEQLARIESLLPALDAVLAAGPGADAVAR